MDAVKKNESLPDVSRTTLAKALKDLGFEYGKRNQNSLLLERPDIVPWRVQFLRCMMHFREEDRTI